MREATRNLEIPGSMLSRCPGMTVKKPAVMWRRAICGAQQALRVRVGRSTYDAEWVREEALKRADGLMK